jgi:hypothetical protein
MSQQILLFSLAREHGCIHMRLSPGFLIGNRQDGHLQFYTKQDNLRSYAQVCLEQAKVAIARCSLKELNMENKSSVNFHGCGWAIARGVLVDCFIQVYIDAPIVCWWNFEERNRSRLMERERARNPAYFI